MTARDVCEELMIILKRPVRIESVILCEVVCNNELVRPIHFSELVFEVLIRWKNWDQRECSKNCLLFKYDDIYQKIMPYVPAHTSVWFSGEIRLADATARSSFKKVWLKFEKVLSDNAGQLSYLKDSMAFKPISSWRINDLTWYIGSESRRQTPTKFAFTFIERIAAVQRTKSRPYFGFTACMKTEEDLLKWMAVMMKGEYPNGIL